MPDYLFFMHDDTLEPQRDWARYIGTLQDAGRFRAGSAVGGGRCIRKSGAAPGITGHIVGFVRIFAESLEDAQALLAGNPVFEAGGTVEIRELPTTDRE